MRRLRKTYKSVLSGGLTSAFLLCTVAFASAESMGDAVRKALTTNPAQKALAADVNATGYELLQSKSEFLPTLDVTGEIGGEVVSNPNVLAVSDSGRLNNTRQVAVSIGLTLFDGWRRANTIFRNASRLDGRIYRFLAASETVALSTVEAYIDVVRHRQMMGLARKNVTRHLEIGRSVRERISGGKSSVGEGFQIDERIAAAKDAVIGVESALLDANAAYVRVVGHEPRGHLKVPHIHHVPSTKDALISASLRSNTSIKEADKLVAEADYDREIVNAERYPNISLNGRSSVGADRSGSRGREVDGFFGLNLSWRLYGGGLRKKQLAALSERELQAQYQRDDRRRDVKEVAVLTWNAYTKGLKRVKVLKSQLESNKMLVSSYIQEFELSKRTLLDVLDVQRAEFNTEVQLVSARAALQFSKFRMLAAQSKLAQHFGVDVSELAFEPDFEDRLLDRPRDIFNIDLEPLR